MILNKLLLLVVLLAVVQCNPLHDAAVNGDVVLLKQLLDNGTYDVNGKDVNGRTPLAASMATCSKWLSSMLAACSTASI